MQTAAFNVDTEYNGDDDALLEWEQYSKARSFRCCGREFSLTPPSWWFQLTRRQRRCILITGGCLTTFTLLIITLAIAAVAGRHMSFGLSSSDTACEWTDWRLPTWVTPSRYNITFNVQMQDPWDVTGHADVLLQVSRPTRCVIMHAKKLVVNSASLGDSQGVPARLRYNEALEQLTFEWNDPLPAGSALIHLEFYNTVDAGLNGLYRSSYTLPNGKTTTIAATQFEANSARSAFPCFDEPAMKAEFVVEVITTAGLVVLSNMPPRAVHSVSDLYFPFAKAVPCVAYIYIFSTKVSFICYLLAA